jgi:putative aldouronate transport system substrate-binding protein
VEKKKSGILVLSILALLVVMTVAGPRSFGAKKKTSGGPVQLDWLAYQTTEQPDPESPIIKAVEKRFNVKFKFWFIDDQRWNEVLNVKFAAGEIPDVFRLRDISNLARYVKIGVLGELPLTTIKKLAPHYYAYIKRADKSKIIWDITSYQGKNYGFSMPNFDHLYPNVMVWRTDWLKNVGIVKKPETLAEFETAMYKFRNNDPDQNGKKDTYGLSVTGFNPVFGAFGIRSIPLRQTDKTNDLFMYNKKNKIVFTPLRPGAKQALALLQKWYKDGVIDPEFVTGENKGGYWALSHSFMENRIGLTALVYYYHYAPPNTAEGPLGALCYQQITKVNPKAQYEMGPPPIGPKGVRGMCQGDYSGEKIGISFKAAKNPAKLNAIMKMLDTMFYDEDYWLLVQYGRKNIDWHFGHNHEIESTQSALDHEKQRGINVVAFLNGNQEYNKKYFASRYEYGEKVTKGYSGYVRPVIPSTQAGDRYLQNLLRMTQEAFIQIITGEKSLDYYDEFVRKFRANGGDAIMKGINETLKK